MQRRELIGKDMLVMVHFLQLKMSFLLMVQSMHFLNISQLYDKSFKVVFELSCYVIEDIQND